MINEEIRDREVRLIDSDGSPLGIVQTKDALSMAFAKNLDLVKIAPQAVPPVCKIIDYGKYRFESDKREKEAKKNQNIVKLKEVRITPSIDDHDLNTKIASASKFIGAGDKVKVTVRFKGREISHSSLGLALLKKFAAAMEEIATVEKPPKLEGKSMALILTPKA